MTQTKIKEKIAKLLKLAANNPNDAEAAVAYGMASDLANRHALDLDAILGADSDDEGEPYVEREVEGIIRRRVEKWKRASAWKASLGQAIARAHRCKSYKVSGYEGGLYVYGQPSDVATVEYLYAAISKEVDRRGREYVAFDERRGRSEGRNYRIGMVHEIATRLRESVDKVLQEAKAEAYAKGGEAALVRVSQVEVYVARVEEAVDKYAEDKLNLQPGRGYTYNPNAAYHAGRAAGRAVNLGGNKAIR